MAYTCEVVDLPERPALSVRSHTSAAEISHMFDRAYSAIGQYLAENNEQPAGPPFAIYYNMDMENLDVEAGFPVARPLPGRGDVAPSRGFVGRAAACLYIGPYQGLSGAYEALTRWVGERGLEPTGIVGEVYLNAPNETPPEELRTQVIFLLK